MNWMLPFNRRLYSTGGQAAVDVNREEAWLQQSRQRGVSSLYVVARFEDHLSLG